MLHNNKRRPGVIQQVELPTLNAQRSTPNVQLSGKDVFLIVRGRLESRGSL